VIKYSLIISQSMFLNTILNIIFPTHCVSCGILGLYFCSECLSKCPYAERESAEWIFPLYDYRHPPIKKAVWLIKYKGKKKLIGVFAESLYGRIAEELTEIAVMENFSSPILIPIPLSRKRLRERGFNQAELLCKEIIKLDKNKFLELGKNILTKPKDTEHQARIRDRKLRLKNLTGSFEVKNEKNLKGRNIILIDDVTTTGATLSEAKKVLRHAGARKIIAFTIAH